MSYAENKNKLQKIVSELESCEDIERAVVLHKEALDLIAKLEKTLRSVTSKKK